MHDPILTLTVVLYVVQSSVHRAIPGLGDEHDSERGAVSIEQVLWYAAAAVSVAVVSIIIWNQIKSTASTGVNTPSAP